MSESKRISCLVGKRSRSKMVNEDIEVIRKLGMLDTLILIWDKWNRREVTADEALYEMYHYLRSDIAGAKKRRELMKTSVSIEKENPT